MPGLFGLNSCAIYTRVICVLEKFRIFYNYLNTMEAKDIFFFAYLVKSR